MLPLPDSEVYLGLVALFVACLPLGAALLRLTEWFLKRRMELSPFERLLGSFYATGGLLFVVASVPAPVYDGATVVGLLAAGAIGYAAFTVRDRGRGLRSALAAFASPTGILLALGSLALLGIEVTSTSVVLPNGIDGSVHALFVNQLLRLHTVAWTLQPYAAVGVIYPQGAAVWMSLPVVLLGWPIVASPVGLPPLFLSFSPAAAFCLGQRLERPGSARVSVLGLILAAFFGTVASWPRLYVGGSYDFIFGLPIFLLGFGFLSPFASQVRTVRESAVAGAALGVTTVLSASVGTALATLLLGYWVASAHRGQAVRRLGGVLLSVGVAAAFLVRSFVGLVVWWRFPGHVMTSNSVPPYAPVVFQATYGNVLSQIDPFMPWKWKFSPIPILAIELQLLLVAGVVLSVLVLGRPSPRLRMYLPRNVVVGAVVGTGSLLLLTTVVGLLGALNTSLSGIQSATNLWQLSILLFTMYSIIAVIPLIGAANFLRTTVDFRRVRVPCTAPVTDQTTERRDRPERRRWAMTVAVVVVAIPLATGFGATATVVPGYLHSYLLGQSNGTADDVLALEWAGDHLPRCSGVLVAPGSAAQFLPEYATVRMIYPVFPTPSNLTYYDIVENLSHGVYENSTEAGLLALGTTEVFVTGPTTNTYRAFSLAPLRTSSDFSLLFGSGDALIFAFGPGISALNCPPD